MIVPSSGSFTCPFQYNPVDREWQQESCEAMGLNYITSNGITPGGREVGLEPPTTFTRIVGDGNCLFRALAHIITGSEEQHMDVRRGIVSHMRTIGNLLVGGHVREGDIDTYIDSSRIEHDREWGTDVEILTLAHMLKTPCPVRMPRTNKRLTEHCKSCYQAASQTLNTLFISILTRPLPIIVFIFYPLYF